MNFTPDTFDTFLQSVFMKLQPGLLDDDLPDAFDSWLGNRDVEDMIVYGQEYGTYLLELFGKHLQCQQNKN